jgi:hypothetical protein
MSALFTGPSVLGRARHCDPSTRLPGSGVGDKLGTEAGSSLKLEVLVRNWETSCSGSSNEGILARGDLDREQAAIRVESVVLNCTVSNRGTQRV